VWSGTVDRRGFIVAAALLTAVSACGASAPSLASPPPVVHVDPVTKEIILELVSTAENSTKRWRSTYGYIEDIDDGHGYTAGIGGWCSGTGDLLELVKRYAASRPGNSLQPFLPALEQIMAAPYASRPSLSHSLLGEAFSTAWAAAALTAPFQAAQRAERDLVLWNPAMVAAQKDHLSTLGQYIYYDVYVNHGPGDSPKSFHGIVAGVQAQGHLPPARGGNEIAYLSAVVAARDAVLPGLGVAKVNDRSSIARKFLRQEKLSLTLPLRWSVYGDSYSITKPPKP
jgi:chitosanase